MSCSDVTERLPWLLNGSLEEGERRRVRDHLEDCASCRTEWAETRQAARVYGAHAPASAVVQMAWERPVTEIDEAAARRHLEHCASCAEELALARRSRQLEEAEPRGVPGRPGRRPGPAWYSGLAAGLAVSLAAGTLWRSIRIEPGGDDPERARLRAQVSSLEDENRRLRETGTAPPAESTVAPEVEAPVAPPVAPQANLPVVELFPAEATTRSAGPAPRQDLRIPADAAFVALVLDSGPVDSRPVAVELQDGGGAVLWSGSGLRPSPLGGFTLGLPASLLGDGPHTILLRDGSGKVVATYPVHVRRDR